MGSTGLDISSKLVRLSQRKQVCLQWIPSHVGVPGNEAANELAGENAIQVADIVNGVYGADTVAANYMQFWFRRFRSGIFNVKDAPCTGRRVVENVDKITEIIEVDRHVSSCSISQELKMDHKKSFKPFVQSWIQKEARFSPINTKTLWIEFSSAKP
ncbi:histone-lysine N-methyltransferase SETMAR [Trichonephila clavipes]|nr:histone-lysine N-methyltransferase SETMAR [Trichonephila clavipes]